MGQRESLRQTVKHGARALMLLALLGTAGCMIRRPAVTSTSGNAVNTTDPRLDNGEQATEVCAQFGCEP
jgi:hypothetical protein